MKLNLSGLACMPFFANRKKASRNMEGKTMASQHLATICQVMACGLIETNPIANPVVKYFNRTLRNEFE